MKCFGFFVVDEGEVDIKKFEKVISGIFNLCGSFFCSLWYVGEDWYVVESGEFGEDFFLDFGD